MKLAFIGVVVLQTQMFKGEKIKVLSMQGCGNNNWLCEKMRPQMIKMIEFKNCWYVGGRG